MENYRSRIRRYLINNWWLYLFVFLCFVTGIVFGSLGVNTLSQEQKTELHAYVDKGLRSFEEKIDFSYTAGQAFYKNFLNWGKILLLGLTVIGMPLVLIIIFTRGFVLGFTIVFLLQTGSFRGAASALLAVLPPNLLSFPAYIAAAVAAINFSLYLLRGRESPRPGALARQLSGYLGLMLLLGLLFAGSALIEGYLSPFFLQFVFFD